MMNGKSKPHIKLFNLSGTTSKCSYNVVLFKKGLND